MAETGETAQTQLIYGRDDRPSFGPSLLAAFAHLFAIVASILTAPLLIARAIGLDVDSTQYVISASLVVSGIATFIQTYRIGPIGSGLLAVQGTSFAFIGTMAYAAADTAFRGYDPLTRAPQDAPTPRQNLWLDLHEAPGLSPRQQCSIDRIQIVANGAAVALQGAWNLTCL